MKRYDGRTIYASDALVQAAHKAGIKVGVFRNSKFEIRSEVLGR